MKINPFKRAVSVILAAVLVILSGKTMPVQAEEPPWSTIGELGVYDEDHSLYFDETMGEHGSLVFITDDARRTSPIYYHTAGFTVYRCYPGTRDRDPLNKIIIRLPDPSEEKRYLAPDGRTRIRAVWYFDYDTQILDPIRDVSEQWYDEVVEQEQETWLYIDGIMQVCFDDDRDGEADRFSGRLSVGAGTELMVTYGPGTNLGISGEGDIYAYGSVYRSANELKNAQSWGGGTSGIESHFGKRVRLTPGSTVPPAGEETGVVDILGHPAPDYTTWNRSTTGEYDLSEAIPSSEGITNYVVCDDYVAQYSTIGRRVTKRYHMTYRITYKYTAEGHNRDGSPYYYDTYVTAVKSYDIDRTARYFYIVNAKVLDWTDAVVYNEAFPDGYVQYESAHDIEVTALASGMDLAAMTAPISPNTFTYEELDASHVTFPAGSGSTKDVTVDMTRDVSGRTYTLAEAQQAAESLDYQSDAQNSLGPVKAHNDTFILNGDTYLDGSEKSGNIIVECPRGERTPSDVPSEYASGVGFEGTPYSRDLIIPDETQNGEYPTKMRADYTTVIPATGEVVSYSCGESDPEHICDMGTPEQETQEPVMVHTPVIAPVHVTGASWEDIQLLHPDMDVMYQFILDGMYTFTFDPAMHNDIQGYGWSGDPSKYDDYVRSKEVRFPFEVRIGSEWYEPGEWITVGNRTTFYIPSWALEGIYTIDYRVTAINENGTGGTQDSANLDPDNYVATYGLTCQVSGQIYDFQVTGLDDKDRFGGFETEAWTSQDYSFSANDEQKRVGANNRLGVSAVRLSDGSIVNSWSSADILPFSVGSSHTMDLMGEIRTGTTLCFTVKTIANLWGENDSIYIRPTYRYVDMDGNVHDDVDIYYNDYMTAHPFVKVGSELDYSLMKESINISDEKFKGSFKESDLMYTAEFYPFPASPQHPMYHYMYNQVIMHNQSEITIPAAMRLFIGAEEELAMNLNKNRDEIGTLVIPDGKEDQFHKSIQQWFGTFELPMDFYVCDAGIDINEYAYSEEGLSESSSIWYKDGYLILNFDIITLKDGNEHLSYINHENNVAYGHCNMWRREGGATTALLEGRKAYETFRIDVYDGDIAAIYMNEHIYDKYEPSYLFSD